MIEVALASPLSANNVRPADPRDLLETLKRVGVPVSESKQRAEPD